MSTRSRRSRARLPSSEVVTASAMRPNSPVRHPDLGADDHVGRFQLLQDAAKVLFRFAIAVQHRGVEIVHAGGDRPRDGALLVGRIAAHHQSAHRAAAEAQHRELHSRATKCPQLHRRSSDGTETMQCRAHVTQPGYFAGAMIGPPTALAFMMSRPYNFGTLGGSVDVDFLSQIRSHIGIGGGALSGRASGSCPSSCPSRPRVILDPRLAARLRESQRRQLEHLRQFSELRWQRCPWRHFPYALQFRGWLVCRQRRWHRRFEHERHQPAHNVRQCARLLPSVQFGYNFQNAPVTVYAGFDTLKYDTNIGSPFAPSTKCPARCRATAHVRASSSSRRRIFSLSFGVGYTQQQSGRVDSDINSSLLPGASPLAVGGRR